MSQYNFRTYAWGTDESGNLTRTEITELLKPERVKPKAGDFCVTAIDRERGIITYGYWPRGRGELRSTLAKLIGCP